MRKQMTSLARYLSKNRHILLALYAPVYVISFFLLEKCITGGYWASYLPLDDRIPFVEAFAIPYCLWYPLLVLPGFFMMFKDPPAFKRYMYFIMAGFSFCLIFYALFPNGQNLRPEAFPRDNFCTRLIGAPYGADTNTNVLPSMHVVGCAAIIAAVFDSPTLKRWRTPITVIGILVAASTVFIKQHSILDVITGAALSAMIWFGIYLAPGLARKRGGALPSGKGDGTLPSGKGSGARPSRKRGGGLPPEPLKKLT